MGLHLARKATDLENVRRQLDHVLARHRDQEYFARLERAKASLAQAF